MKILPFSHLGLILGLIPVLMASAGIKGSVVHAYMLLDCPSL